MTDKDELTPELKQFIEAAEAHYKATRRTYDTDWFEVYGGTHHNRSPEILPDSKFCAGGEWLQWSTPESQQELLEGLRKHWAGLSRAQLGMLARADEDPAPSTDAAESWCRRIETGRTRLTPELWRKLYPRLQSSAKSKGRTPAPYPLVEEMISALTYRDADYHREIPEARRKVRSAVNRRLGHLTDEQLLAVHSIVKALTPDVRPLSGHEGKRQRDARQYIPDAAQPLNFSEAEAVEILSGRGRRGGNPENSPSQGN